MAIIGLGYVGLPLAMKFAKIRPVVCYDISLERVRELQKGYDSTKEVQKKEILAADNLNFTSNPNDLKDCNCYIITVPTPINTSRKPDTSSLENATRQVGEFLGKDNIVIFESTVYPGLTEEICVPLLEKTSGLKYNDGFYCGYSPERINPGDKKRDLSEIVKVTSGSNSEAALLVDQIYKEIIVAGTHLVSAIKVAEAAKIIENTQRDINIALINELSIIFEKIGLDTEEVLEAAETKWNFLRFRPGLVGGHCIGVDPYYLTYKAEKIGHKPKMILAGRTVNENMAFHVVKQLKKKMDSSGIDIFKAQILILGLAFKENCPDTRNSKVFDINDQLILMGCKVDVFDPIVNADEVFDIPNLNLIKNIKTGTYDAILICVAHDQFKNFGIIKIKSFGKKKNIIYDLKYVFKKNYTDLRL